jgi:GH18 family chitinase
MWGREESRFRIIGYATEGVIAEAIPYGQLTHINYAFLIPNADGTADALHPFENLANPWKLEKIVALAHAQGVQVLISVGGWGWDEQFEVLAADPQRRAAFVSQLTALVTQYDLDGADIDWEYPDEGQSAQNFLALIQELRRAMPGKLLTCAVVATGPNVQGVLPETFALFDFVNIMAYDGEEPTMRLWRWLRLPWIPGWDAACRPGRLFWGYPSTPARMARPTGKLSRPIPRPPTWISSITTV